MEQQIICEFRITTKLPLDDCLIALKEKIPALTRSNLHRCLKQNGLSVLPKNEDEQQVEHRLTKFKHPWTNGQVEIFNKTIKDATTKTYHYETTDELKRHVMSYLLLHNYQKKLKVLKFKSPYAILLEKFDSNPELFK